MKYHQIPAGYPSFEAVEKIFRDKLPEKFAIVTANSGGKMPKNTGGAMVGSIVIRQNSYNGAMISFTSNDGILNDNISVVEMTPSNFIAFFIRFVGGWLTNLIFPAIYGTRKEIYSAIDEVVMNNFSANEMDISFGATMKSMFKGKGITEIKKSSI